MLVPNVRATKNAKRLDLMLFQTVDPKKVGFEFAASTTTADLKEHASRSHQKDLKLD